LGGHCIPVDPLYLGWKLRTLNYRARFVELADHVNSTMPNYVVFRAAAALNDQSKSIRGAKILLLGMAYKADVSDVRESPALPIAEQLLKLGAQLDYTDPHVPQVRLKGIEMKSCSLTQEGLEEYDLVIALTAHNEFDLPWIAKHASRILDTRDAFQAIEDRNGIVKL
jgi:UDP-N-acetyl-D-glucosamine dehydrogenase